MGYASLPFAPPRHHQNLRLRTLYEKSCVKLQTHNILPRRRRERVRSVPERPPLEAASLRPHLHPRHPAFWPHGDDRGIISSSSLVNTAFSLNRHILYLWVCWSIYAHIPEEIQYGCYKGSVEDLQGPYPTPNDWDHLTQPFRDPVGLVCWNNNIKWTFLGMLLALQCIMILWFVLICKVAYKVVTGQGAEDNRSDDEDEGDDEGEDIEDEKTSFTGIGQIHLCHESRPYLESEVLSTDANFSLSGQSKSKSTSKGSSSPVRKTSSEAILGRRKAKHEAAHSSSVNLLAGSSDRKELLGRIGCDKGSPSD